MSVGLIALLDDIAALAKLAAASLDDVGAAAGKASAKAAGVVIDDAAVTPRYVTGLSPERELPIIARIAIGSLRNKLLILLPAALLLSAFAPWALTPLLMLGGSYLCFEGAEKLIEKWLPHGDGHDDDAPVSDDPTHIEQSTISGAVRTDLILSAEIMAIALASVAHLPLWEQAVILVVVSLLITVGVYGVVALIVKLDDIGLHLCKGETAALQPVGRGLVQAMPHVLTALTVAGTAAMLWVGGGIVVHGLETLGIGFPGHQIAELAHHLSEGTGAFAPVAEWFVHAFGSALAGLVLGGMIALLWMGFNRLRR
ncbi:DUF808 domain-containing protein [Sphingobium subterraneum]|uniref:ABC transporter n=1 Tax=Sphingobium subterraneum TaxID=627688 RepID=A0A841J1L0_9SPHN|nr:DUF808 domain-containing protein [Sphingobium subterraneum]MBB6122545.1 hypothetical protein [Sphingobium subterraneum]